MERPFICNYFPAEIDYVLYTVDMIYLHWKSRKNILTHYRYI